MKENLSSTMFAFIKRECQFFLPLVAAFRALSRAMDNPEQNKNSELVLQHQVYRLYFIDDPQH
jgi:hypothetical protein